ncbi:MAG: cytochrome b/b6 domain-containing protein, partial [Bacillota bacterium]
MLRKAIYVWEWPVRFYHWLNVFLIITLFLTGLYIGFPKYRPAGTEAYSFFLMGKARYWHGWAAWLFIANFLFRFYWAFVGNEYA